MKKLILASIAAIGMFGIAACSDSGTDGTTTQSTTPPATEQVEPMAPDATAPTVTPAPETGTGGAMQTAPAEPAPAQ